MDAPEIPAGAGLPRDVWDAADEAVEAIVASIWQSEADGVQISWGEARMAVGRAILAERERCAQIADAQIGEPIHLKQAGARWFHSDDYASPNLTKASLGLFFHEVLKAGAHVGSIWVFNAAYDRSGVYVSVFMTEEMKAGIEGKTRFRFRDPPKVSLNCA